MSPNERAAFYISPLLAPVVWTAVLCYPDLSFGIGDFVSTVAIVGILGIPLAYLMALCIGWPLYIAAKKINAANYLCLSLGGTVVGALPTLVMLLFMYDSWPAGREWKVHGVFAVTGFVVGSVFWGVARYWPHNQAFKRTV